MTAETFTFALRRDRLRAARRREGHYLLRSSLAGEDPATLRGYMRLAEIEQAFKELKHDLAIRPVFHQRDERIEAHIFVAFVAYCLHVTLKNMARPRASGLAPRAILEKLSTTQMVDCPRADDRRPASRAAPAYRTHPGPAAAAPPARPETAGTAAPPRLSTWQTDAEPTTARVACSADLRLT